MFGFVLIIPLHQEPFQNAVGYFFRMLIIAQVTFTAGLSPFFGLVSIQKDHLYLV